MKDVEGAIVEYMDIHGYSGLYSEEECGCTLDNLMMCEECPAHCLFGHETDCGKCAAQDCEGRGEWSVCASGPVIGCGGDS